MSMNKGVLVFSVVLSMIFASMMVSAQQEINVSLKNGSNAVLSANGTVGGAQGFSLQPWNKVFYLQHTDFLINYTILVRNATQDNLTGVNVYLPQ